MTPQQIKLVRTSWARIVPSADQVAVLFYDRLFEIAPEAALTSPIDQFEQGKTLMQTLNLVVKRLSELDDLQPVLNELGDPRADTAIFLSYDGPAREALLWTLHQGLGDDFTSDLEQAWRQVFAAMGATATQSPVATAV